MIKKAMVVVLFMLLIGSVLYRRTRANDVGDRGVSGMRIWSPAFEPNGMIPVQYTCDAATKDQPIELPPLMWENVPHNTKSLALIYDDPDAPSGMWVHGVIFNIDPTVTNFASGIDNRCVIGKNSWGKNKVSWPCPPSGIHRYFFKIYALDMMLNLDAQATKDSLEKAMRGHIVEQAQLIARYGKAS